MEDERRIVKCGTGLGIGVEKSRIGFLVLGWRYPFILGGWVCWLKAGTSLPVMVLCI